MSAVGSDQRRHVVQGIGSSAGGTWYLPRWASWYLESVCRRYHGHLNGSCNDNIELYFVDHVPVSSMKCGRLLARPKDRPPLPSGYFLDPVSVAHQHISHSIMLSCSAGWCWLQSLRPRNSSGLSDFCCSRCDFAHRTSVTQNSGSIQSFGASVNGTYCTPYSFFFVTVPSSFLSMT